MDRATRRRVLATSAASLAAIAGCSSPSSDGDGGDSGDGGDVTTVEMTSDFAFDPDTVEVGVGETVVWENVGGGQHSVTAYEDDIPNDAEYFASGGFDGEEDARGAWPDGGIEDGDKYENTFQTAGTYEYFCIPHESTGMTGTVEVG